MNLLLFIIAWILKAALSPLLLAYGLIRCAWIGANEGYQLSGFIGIFIGAFLALDFWFGEMATALDQFGNTMGMFAWNDWLKKDVKHDTHTNHGYSFGDRLDTISYALGRNAYKGTVTRFAKAWIWFLNLLDRDHSHRAHVKGNNRINKKLLDLE